jgi:hypothetical protein
METKAMRKSGSGYKIVTHHPVVLIRVPREGQMMMRMTTTMIRTSIEGMTVVAAMGETYPAASRLANRHTQAPAAQELTSPAMRAATRMMGMTLEGMAEAPSEGERAVTTVIEEDGRGEGAVMETMGIMAGTYLLILHVPHCTDQLPHTVSQRHEHCPQYTPYVITMAMKGAAELGEARSMKKAME